ncbi:MAG: VOC family protein [Vicinamibacteria bacterium]
MFESPSHVVIGATDVARMCAFLERMGLEPAGAGRLDAAAARDLYGIEAPLEERVLCARGAREGRVVVVSTPHAAPSVGPFDRGAHAIDFYTTDIRRSLALAREAGAETHDFAEYAVGPLTIREGKAVGPDALYVVFIEVGRRRPSVLDADAARLHSEIHSAVWVVESVDAALPFWRDALGLKLLLDATVREPGVAKFMGLPRPDTPLRLAVLADGAQRPIRYELIEFPEDSGGVRPGFPLRAGLHAVAFEVASLAQAMAALPAARFGPIARLASQARPTTRAVVSGEGPGGVRLELWEAAG